jgi:hypothetical protein
MGKILKVEIVQAYFRQVHRLSAEEMPPYWQDFKTNTLGQDVADDLLTQEQLRTLSLECKEHCRRKKVPPIAPLLVLEPIVA